MNYERQANAFAKKHGVKLEVIGEPFYEKYFLNDNSKRYIFKMRISRKGKGSYTFTFGQSVASGKKVPTMYDVLATFTKYIPDDYNDFLSEFGYQRNAQSKKIFTKVVREGKAVEKLFGDVMDELQEIQ